MLVLIDIPVHKALFFVFYDGKELVVLFVDHRFEDLVGSVLGWRRRDQLRKHAKPALVVFRFQNLPFLDSTLVFFHVDGWVLGWGRRVVGVLDVFVYKTYLYILLIIISFNFRLGVLPLTQSVVFVAGWDWEDALAKENFIGGRNPLILHEFALLAASLRFRAPLHNGLVF